MAIQNPKFMLDFFFSIFFLALHKQLLVVVLGHCHSKPELMFEFVFFIFFLTPFEQLLVPNNCHVLFFSLHLPNNFWH
jgi:hypothetical protein